MEKNSFLVAQITDTHIFSDSRGELYGVHTDSSLNAVLDDIESGNEQPDIVLATGDLVHDETEIGYQRFVSHLARRQWPVYCLPGNHDDPAIMLTHYRDGPVYFKESFIHRGWQFLMLDTHRSGEVGGALSEEQFARLRSYLSRAAENHVIVCLHHQPVPINSRWLDAIGLAQAERFLEMVCESEHVKAVVWGHIHQEWEEQRGHVRLFGAPSTCAQFAPGQDEFGIDPAGPGWRWLRLYDDGSIESGIRRVVLSE